MRLRYALPIAVALLTLAGFLVTYTPTPERFEYGMTFSVLYAEEIGLDWKVAYKEMLEDLKVKKLRIPVYWSRVESEKGVYSWNEIDYQLAEARAHDAEVILAFGRRVPRWPECHEPSWIKGGSWEDQKEHLRTYIRALVEHYREDPTIAMWQVENEPYLTVFATKECGGDLDQDFYEEEIALVRSLDDRPILATDSGNLGSWYGAYSRGGVFGTSIYLYFWNDAVGFFRTVLPPAYYRVKANIMRFLYGERSVMVSELSLEPWLGKAFFEVPHEEQLSRMNIDTFREIIEYAKETNIGTQYLWGVEWWYYMRTKADHPEFWNAAREMFSQ